MKSIRHYSQYLFSAVFLMAPTLATSDSDPPYEIVVYKKDRILQVRKGSDVVRHYATSVGLGGQGHKQQRGDKKTPIGTYTVLEIRPSDRYHMFMHLNYPNLPDAVRAYRQGRINGVEYQKFREAHARSSVPPQNTELGGQIGIHGLGGKDDKLSEIHSLFNWTQGCVALTDQEIEQLQEHVMVGTPVTIYE